MRTRNLALLLLAPILALGGCIIAIGPGVSDDVHSNWSWSGKRGSGVSATQTRAVAEFHAIRVECSCDVDVSVGQERQLTITADDNLIDDLATEVAEGVLVISTREGSRLSFRVGPKATISVPSLDGLYIDGSGDAEVRGVSGESFSARINGSGDVRVAGNVTRLDFAIRGSGDGDLSALEAVNASVSIEGSGDVRLHCSGSLSAAVSGSGDIEYIGSPQTSISISGSGDVHPVR